MFFYLSKILLYLIRPIFIITLCVGIALLTKRKKAKKIFFILSFFFFILFTNEFVANEIQHAWEYQPMPIKDLQNYDLGIVLTGVTDSKRIPKDRVYIHWGADRVLHALQLYRLGKIKRILISGGSGSLIPTEAEAYELKRVFLLAGVPEKDILIEADSKNTHENAVFSKKILDNNKIKGPTLLITSAFHMRRALGCFNKAGINPHVFPVEFHSHERRYTPNVLLFPSEAAIGIWATLIHEMVGYIVYKITGYC